MPITYNALDNEFAASSGDNVNVTPDYSYFDYPPNSTKDLTITSNDGDDDPSVFEVGDTYDLAWGGHSTGAIDNAVVIRSDYVGPGQGAIVFEGVSTDTGELQQVVWSPGFDLEGWYWDNGGGPSSPNAFWTSDQDSSETAQYVCFVRGTRIRTPHGRRRVENLRTGAMVTTLDHGNRPVLWSGMRRVAGKGRSAPVVFRPGAIGNKRQLALSPNHRVLLASPIAAREFGAEEVFVPAKALVNNFGIRIEQRREVDYHHLLFSDHEVLEAEGLLTESLYTGPVSVALMKSGGTGRTPDPVPPDHIRPGAMQLARPALTYKEGRRLAEMIGIVQSEALRPPQPGLIPA